nr:MAG TPA: hypothetical protein [Bacteriophage sp.]
MVIRQQLMTTLLSADMVMVIIYVLLIILDRYQ